MCQWLDYGQSLADRGRTVLLFDFNGHGLSQLSDDFFSDPRHDEDLLAALDTLRGHDADSIALVGASMGATAAVVVAGRLGDVVDRVAEVSGDAAEDGLDAVGAAHDLGIPLLCVAAEGVAQPAADAQRICEAATSAPSHETVIVPDTAAHGVLLLDPDADPHAETVNARLDDFLPVESP